MKNDKSETVVKFTAMIERMIANAAKVNAAIDRDLIKASLLGYGLLIAVYAAIKEKTALYAAWTTVLARAGFQPAQYEKPRLAEYRKVLEYFAVTKQNAAEIVLAATKVKGESGKYSTAWSVLRKLADGIGTSDTTDSADKVTKRGNAKRKQGKGKGIGKRAPKATSAADVQGHAAASADPIAAILEPLRKAIGVYLGTRGADPKWIDTEVLAVRDRILDRMAILDAQNGTRIDAGEVKHTGKRTAKK